MAIFKNISLLLLPIFLGACVSNKTITTHQSGRVTAPGSTSGNVNAGGTTVSTVQDNTPTATTTVSGPTSMVP